MVAIKVNNLSFAYNGKPVLRDISVDIGEGERWAVIGMNGAGKSTLVRCIAGLEHITHGNIKVCGKDVSACGARDLAKVLAYVPQAQRQAAPFSVFEYVMMGRFPYQGIFAAPSREDCDIVNDALELADVISLCDRMLSTLSGGELQRVLLAGAISQRAGIMLLDEPATFLDPLHQELMRKALDRVHERFNTTILTVTHDINDAILRHSNMLALVEGACFFAGTAADFLVASPSILASIYRMEFHEAVVGSSGRRLMTPAVHTGGKAGER